MKISIVSSNRVIDHISEKHFLYASASSREKWMRWRKRCFFSIDEPTLSESEEHYDHICHNILWERNETALLAKEKAQVLERFIP